MQLIKEADLLTLVQNAPIGICILDAETLVAELLNDKYLEVAGKPREQIIGHRYWDAFPEFRDPYQPILDKVVQTGIAYHADEVSMMLLRQGRPEPVFVTFVYAPVITSTGQVSKVAVWVLENTSQVRQREKVLTAKLAVQRERDRLQEFLMQAPAGICILQGESFIYELVNPLYQQLFPGRELLGKPLLEALPEIKDTPIIGILQEVFTTGKPFEASELLVPLARTPDGPIEDRYFNFIYRARQDENGYPDGILVFVIEVTSMMLIQQQLRDAREKADQQKRVYETITSATPDLMYVWDLDYRFTYANSALLTMWGKTWDTAIGKGLRENGYEEWHALMHEREIDQVRATKQPVRGEVSFPHAVLGRRMYDYILIPVLNEAGEVEAVAGTTRDVTERKQMEQALAKSRDELQEINEELAATNEEQAASNEELITINEELALVNNRLAAAQMKIEENQIALRLAIEAANIGTWYVHSVTREMIADARLKELFGYNSDEPLSVEQALAQVTDEYRELVAAKLENAINHGEDFDVIYPVIGLNDQRMRWLRAIGNLAPDPSGTFSAFTGVIMDVTEQKADEQRKNDFIGMASHELKTPLTSLTAIIQVAHAKLKNSEDPFMATAMHKANVQVKRMAAMINGFLNLSRLESARLIIEKSSFDLSMIIADVVKETELTAPAHRISLMNHEKMIINADHDKITSVISNLLSNAVKYSPRGSEIQVGYVLKSRKVQVSVSDQGMGLTEADQLKVFDRYYRAENTQMHFTSGFGIGLYLSAEIITRHNGAIWVESELGKGSTFYFTLPV
ncbi:PAS domain-containing protein [Niabella yanshanensis]|uniref:histidine kinase n=1 Tax=Niabella yanshanensis TaxID=577386 RepID=A0ABZ0W530_9BACT|nr:PAS domain-containing protein [Niabella yanshanensis]WQD38360.1 PAS domain-containing protein [Niabella yanshanensis]